MAKAVIAMIVTLLIVGTIAALSFWAMGDGLTHKVKACEQLGGALVRGRWDYVCVRPVSSQPATRQNARD